MKHVLTSLAYAAPLWALVSLSAGPAYAAAASCQPAATNFGARTFLTDSLAKTTRAGRPTAGVKQGRPVVAVTTIHKEPAAALPTAPQTVMLRGVVSLPTGQPQPGASVYAAGAPRQLVVTDAQGAFILPVPAGAAVSLRIEYFGEGTSRLEVLAPTTEVLHITLGH